MLQLRLHEIFFITCGLNIETIHLVFCRHLKADENNDLNMTFLLRFSKYRILCQEVRSMFEGQNLDQLSYVVLTV